MWIITWISNFKKIKPTKIRCIRRPNSSAWASRDAAHRHGRSVALPEATMALPSSMWGLRLTHSSHPPARRARAFCLLPPGAAVPDPDKAFSLRNGLQPARWASFCGMVFPMLHGLGLAPWSWACAMVLPLAASFCACGIAARLRHILPHATNPPPAASPIGLQPRFPGHATLGFNLCMRINKVARFATMRTSPVCPVPPPSPTPPSSRTS